MLDCCLAALINTWRCTPIRTLEYHAPIGWWTW
ncbi:hypothetical protein DFR74_112220 [Nocardia puris]|uniref:Uncharacterized protein n=1 Tax=Nocardia puris TaxID=208602 RepID=A0A366DAJ1_9NOCA|nr:hypothetical protein DFR74_112220 [Nocardia puris]